MLASIYRADGGRARIAGRVAPFIELGVGFNHELTARENGVLNGVLMGLTLREARARLDAVMAFAELEDFVDLQLKNYSSGMLVRLAFALMVQADADVMLIDEVLAVGDAAFAQKCMDVFREKRRAGKTIVLVTHDMTTVQTLCHRAMLLHDGELRFIGEPEDAALALLPGELRRRGPGGGRRARQARRRQRARRHACASATAPATNVAEGEPIGLEVVLEAARAADAPELHLPRAQRGGPDALRAHAAARRRCWPRARTCALAGTVREPAAARPLHARPATSASDRGGGRPRPCRASGCCISR